MSFYFHHEAEIELQDAINYYEDIRIDLGHDFAECCGWQQINFLETE